MRILFFSPHFELHGKHTYSYYSEEINALVKNYPDTEILVYNVNREENKVKRYSKNILLIERKSLRNITTDILFIRDMIKIFTKFKPDVIHSVYVIESIIMGFLGTIFRTPSILHGRGKDLNYFPFINFRKNILAKIGGLLNNTLITVSKAMQNDCIKLNINKNKILTIYDGIDFSLFKPEENKIRKNKEFEILCIGRFSFEKSHNLIIEASKDLRDNDIEFRLTFIGEGELKEKITKLINVYKLKEHIRLEGWVDHDKIPVYMKEADLYLQPSITEGLPISVLEAMSMKLPLVLTKVGGMPELAKDKGTILIDVNNKKQLYDAILYYFNNPQDLEIGGKINSKFVRNTFNWDAHAKKLYNAYMKLKKK